MSPLAIAGIALLLGLVIGTTAVAGAPIFAIPIVLIALAVLGLGQMRRRAENKRSMGELRQEASAEKVEFTERDRETLA